MASPRSSSVPYYHAQGNQSNHGSVQVNEPMFVSCGTFSLTDSSSPSESTGDSSPSFAVGWIPQVDANLRPARPFQPPPTVTESQLTHIHDEAQNISQQYKSILNTTKMMKRSARVIRLKRTVRDQQRSVQTNCKRIINTLQRWALKTQSDRTPKASLPISETSELVGQIQDKLETITDQLRKCVEQLDNIIKPRRATRRRSAEILELCRQFEPDVEDAQIHVTELTRLAYSLSAGPISDVRATAGFTELHHASLATRMLYQCLCTAACPLAVPSQHNLEHAHRALIGLVPAMPPKSESIVKLTAYIAIQSTVNNESHIWFKAQSIPPIPYETSTEEDGLTANLIGSFSARSELSPSPSSPPTSEDEEPEPQTSRRSSRSSDRRASGQIQGGEHRIFYVHNDRLPRETSSPLTLSNILDQGQQETLNPSSSYFRSHALKRFRSLVAIRIVEATMTFGWREWLCNGMNSSNIVFYQCRNTFEAFLVVQMGDQFRTHKARFLQGLGILLLEVGLWRQLHITDPESQVDSRQMEDACQQLLYETAEEYYEAVRYCLQFKKNDSDDSNNLSFLEGFYQMVVSPLKVYAARQTTALREEITTR
ncbi:hypothetical protein NM208_g9805 [Fusarium decemcellulare]|uniref:Uncharacterized protein n=1 Tax=Fusarium decemcellulare TaxID=57161 RepID=A0ACC1S074_9HYPO|nr:hypothetical protein NM208_g9805 [Fusarium decemcellulare]